MNTQTQTTINPTGCNNSDSVPDAALTTPDNEGIGEGQNDLQELSFREDPDNSKSMLITPQMLLDEAVAENDKAMKLDAERMNFSKHFLSLAITCGSSPVFNAVCTRLEESKHWGKAPKGSSKEVRGLYSSAPKTWVQYKARINKAFKENPQLIGQATYERITKHPETGEEKVVRGELDSVAKLNTQSLYLSKLEAEKERAHIEGGDGEGKGDNTTEHGISMPEHAAILSSLSELLSTCTDDKTVDQAMKTIGNLIKKVRKYQPEDKTDQTEDKEAAAA